MNWLNNFTCIFAGSEQMGRVLARSTVHSSEVVIRRDEKSRHVTARPSSPRPPIQAARANALTPNVQGKFGSAGSPLRRRHCQWNPAAPSLCRTSGSHGGSLGQSSGRVAPHHHNRRTASRMETPSSWVSSAAPGSWWSHQEGWALPPCIRVGGGGGFQQQPQRGRGPLVSRLWAGLRQNGQRHVQQLHREQQGQQ